MYEWGIWSSNEWWADKSGLVFHTITKEVALAQLDQICEHWLARDGVGHFSIKSFRTGEIIRTEHPGQAYAEWLELVTMRQEHA